MVWGLIGSGFALFLSATGIKTLAINSLIVMLVIYAFQGLSIVLFFLNRYNVHPLGRLGVFFLIIFFQQVFFIGLSLGGLFDQWINFRKLFEKRTNGGSKGRIAE